MRRSLLCLIGLHRYGPYRPTGFPPMFVLQHCVRRNCLDTTIRENWLEDDEP